MTRHWRSGPGDGTGADIANARGKLPGQHTHRHGTPVPDTPQWVLAVAKRASRAVLLMYFFFKRRVRLDRRQGVRHGVLERPRDGALSECGGPIVRCSYVWSTGSRVFCLYLWGLRNEDEWVLEPENLSEGTWHYGAWGGR